MFIARFTSTLIANIPFLFVICMICHISLGLMYFHYTGIVKLMNISTIFEFLFYNIWIQIYLYVGKAKD